jgi:parvulin-like peptidyl-prolyl isomerase
MSVLKITLAGMGAAVALVAAGCGGGSASVPDGVVAVVDGTDIPTSEVDKLMGYAKNAYESGNQEFPKAGTPDYQSVKQQALAVLVEREELRQTADDLGIAVTDKDIDKAEKAFIAEKFAGKRADYMKALKAQGFTVAEYRTYFEDSVLKTKLFDELTKDVEVSDEEVLAYYTQNQANYPDAVDYEKSKVKADRILAQLESGASFAELAKKNSADPGSKDSGGKLTIKRGETVPEFDKVAFALDVGETSKPVRTQFGYHIIEALSPVKNGSRDVRHILIAEKGSNSFESYKETIRLQLLQQRKNEEYVAWQEDLVKKYDGKVSYAEGYEAPTLPEVPTTATE